MLRVYFFAESLGVFGAFLFDAMQALQFFFLLPQFLDDALHRRGHERGGIFHSRSRGDNLFLVSLAHFVKEPAHGRTTPATRSARQDQADSDRYRPAFVSPRLVQRPVSCVDSAAHSSRFRSSVNPQINNP